MKISEAINLLNNLKEKHGDLELKHPIDYEIGFDEITTLEVWEEKDELICYFTS